MGQEFWMGLGAGAAVGAIVAAMVVYLLFGKAKAPEPPKPTKPSGAPLRMLALLQREGRLLDFLMEDISGAPDAQVGYGVREMHRKCQDAIKKALDLEPVLPNNEDDSVEINAGFDPSAIRLTGNVAGSPPFKGRLIHPGWRVKTIRAAAPPEGADEFVLAPAEVEMP
jgi:Domain of unknown function (DUF2760)